jgi:hypothetical protein
MEGVRAAVCALAKRGLVKLVFVVPPDVYPRFEKQDYRTQRRTAWKAAIPADVKCVKQFVLCLPLLMDKEKEESKFV